MVTCIPIPTTHHDPVPTSSADMERTRTTAPPLWGQSGERPAKFDCASFTIPTRKHCANTLTSLLKPEQVFTDEWQGYDHKVIPPPVSPDKSLQELVCLHYTDVCAQELSGVSF
jgi:hypothetical protein